MRAALRMSRGAECEPPISGRAVVRLRCLTRGSYGPIETRAHLRMRLVVSTPIARSTTSSRNIGSMSRA